MLKAIYINIHRPDEAFDLKSEYILVSVMANLLIKKNSFTNK